MIRVPKLNYINDETPQICCKLSQTGCNCGCPSCQGFVDCVDCPSLTLGDIQMNIYRDGNFNTTTFPPVPNYILTYNAYTWQSPIVCFFIDTQLLSLPAGRYVGDVFVKGVKALNGLLMQIGSQYSTCSPYVMENVGTGNDMQI